MPLAFGALREGDIRLCTEGKVTRISFSPDLYWSAYEPILVDDRTSTGHASNQYWSAREAVLVTIGDQYWSDYRPVLVAPPLLRVRCEAYVYEGIVRDALLG